jgi:N-acetylmuramoyl-L-alanine amidase
MTALAAARQPGRSAPRGRWLAGLLAAVIGAGAARAAEPEPGSAAQALPGARETVTLQSPDGLRPLRAIRDGKDLYLHLGDLAEAVGGSAGRDPLSRDPLFIYGEHRVLFSSRDKRIAVNGKRRRLSNTVEFRHDGIYIPADFLDKVLEELMGAKLSLREAPPTPVDVARQPPPARDADEPMGRPVGEEPVEPIEPIEPERGDGRVRVIAIDPGHGGAEEGAAGPSGLLEKHVALDVALRLREQLRKKGFEIILTRDSDKDVPLEERTALANHHRADIFVSIHANSSPSSTASGAETYYLSLERADRAGRERFGLHETDALMMEDEPSDPLEMVLWDLAQANSISESSILAETIQADFNELLGIPDRGVKQAPLRVLVGALMPAVLVEIGFISNEEEERRLQDPVFIDQLVDSLTRSIEAYRDRMGRRGRNRQAFETGATGRTGR